MSSKYLPASNPVKSFWLTAEVDFKDLRSTEELPAEADIVIVGSGYAGSTMAYYLMQEQFSGSMVMLEARDVCTGATARNGGHLKPSLYYSHKSWKHRYGEKGAAEIVNFEHAHLKAVKEIIEQEKIDCDFVLTRSCDVHLTKTAEQDCIDNYYDMMRNPYITCKHDTQILFGEAAKNISHVVDSNVCVTFTAGQLWPYKLMTSLLRKCLEKGLNLQTNTPVLGTEKRAGKWLVKTSRGTILAKKVVFATNAYTASVEPKFENKIVPIKGMCSHITPENRPAHLNNTYGIRYDGADQDYLINRPDGSVIVGGAKKHIFPFKNLFYNVVDDSTLVPGSERYFDGYMKRFHTWDTTKATTDYVWSGILGYTDDSFPYVGEMPHEEGKFVIAGFHGHGMPRVLLSSKALAKAVLGKDKNLAIPSAFKLSEQRLKQTNNRILQSLGTPEAKL
ncbi:hypothetical protein OGAPHI_004678 [Ogataea philodendri]|uniref:FAD dependent oxidoreductase domain-containing protein n=1 Tax=Ogataea philodendri TaxID=1378263 RepID=A0A9P8T397_9ASCO|nr:uncharacterized protein OGAPHI_004678 [Ogataea philodendri]KAH3663964.1 hypothetical protein OGAPHI_004678 [Ogataea philodendri]